MDKHTGKQNNSQTNSMYVFKLMQTKSRPKLKTKADAQFAPEILPVKQIKQLFHRLYENNIPKIRQRRYTI